MSAGTDHHHGMTLRDARIARGMTQPELAERWPSGAVTARYVQKVESGEKRLSDQQLLRALADLLGIPLWRFGLSEYNPFDPARLPGHGERMYNETLDAVKFLVDQTWYLRRTAPMPKTEQSTHRLLDLFASLVVSLPPTAQLEQRFLSLYAQARRLQAVMLVERREYKAALLAFHEMLQVAEQLGEPAAIALALMGIGTELERAGHQQEAVDRLEQARDVSFNASRQVAALVNSYLARAYASNHEALRFQRAIDTAQTIATNLGPAFGNGEDYVFHHISSVLAERSYGLLEIGEPKKVLELRPEVEAQIDATNNTWLYAWIPADYARAYLMLGEVEMSVAEGRIFLERALRLQSPHAISRAYGHLAQLEAAGFANERAVRGFRDEIQASAEFAQQAQEK